VIRELLLQAEICAQPEGETPKKWCESLFQETSGMARLAETMIQRGMDPEEMDRARYVVIEYVLPAVYLGD
jgi:hypothetical protein